MDTRVQESGHLTLIWVQESGHLTLIWVLESGHLLERDDRSTITDCWLIDIATNKWSQVYGLLLIMKNNYTINIE